jgi:hypothetical protein
MQDFLLTHGEKFPRPLWEVSMEMWERVTLVLTKNADTGKTLTILSETICDLFVKLKSSFQPTDTIRVIRIMRLLALFQSDNEGKVWHTKSLS